MRPLQANTLTADPLLRLMIALEGIELFALDPERAWRIFREFLRIPAAGEDDASFQAEWVGAEGDTVRYQLAFTRQLTDDAGGYGIIRRQVAVQFAYEFPAGSGGGALELWRSEYGSLEQFIAAVEATEDFAYLMAHAVMADLYQEEESVGEDVA